MYKKIMRKVLFLLVAVLIFSCGSFAFAEEDGEGDWEHSFGDFSYGIKEDNTITITNYYSEETIECVIPAEINGMKVTHIGSGAFRGEDDLTSIIIPQNVVSIGDAAFESCKSLTKIVLPKGLRNIGEWAFYNCNSLTDVIIPDGVTSIRVNAFDECDSLTSITIPDSVTSIGSDAFGTDCVIYGDANSFVHEYAKENGLKFQCRSHSYGNDDICDGCGFEKLPPGTVDYGTCGENVRWALTSEGVLFISGSGEMGRFSEGFDSSLVKKVIVKEGIDSISFGDYNDFSNLAEITISEGVTSIRMYDCPLLTKVNIPDSATDIYFGECTGLTSITIPEGTTFIRGSAFRGCSNLKSVTIPTSVKLIQMNAFSGCKSLSTVTIPNGVEEIKSNAFSGCSSLISVDIPSSVTEIQGGVFYGCTSLTTVTLPSSITIIDSSVFYGCSSLTSLNIPSSVTTIRDQAFKGCINLTSLTIPSSVTSIGVDAFYDCFDLVIYGTANSYAHKSAKQSNIKFMCLKHAYGSDYICDGCGYVNEALKPAPCTHAWQSATCTTPKTCTKCKIMDGTALGHNPGDAQVAVKATTSKDGKIEIKCTRCSVVLKNVAIKKASKVSLSTASYVYNGKTKSPKIVVKDSAAKTISSRYYTVSKASGRKAIGKYTYTVKFKGNYSGTKKLTLTIKPVKPTIQTPKAAKKAITVKWKKGSKSQVTDYEVMVATNSKFTKNKKIATVKGYSKTSYKMTKLKAKTKYYVKVRTYKTVKGKKIYSDWSKVKTIKTK